MKRRSVLGATAVVLTAASVGVLPKFARGEGMNEQAKATLDTAFAFMDAMGKGDMDGMTALMADDMVWHNEGDESLPWIGNWEGKDAVLGFLSVYGENVQTLAWDTEDSFASGDAAAFFGTMNAKLTKTGKETGPSPSPFASRSPTARSNSGTGWKTVTLSAKPNTGELL